MKPETKEEKFDILSLIPAEWKSPDGKYYLLQSTYQTLLFDPHHHNLDYISGLLGDVFYIVIGLAEGIAYKHVEYHWTTDTNGPLMNVGVAEKKTQKGSHLMLFTPYQIDGPIPESIAFAKIETALGLLSAVEGRNATFEHKFNQVLKVPDGVSNILGPAQLNPLTIPSPFTDLARLPEVHKKISATDSTLQARISLALRWYDKSERDIDPLDSFLKAWFALEVLAMPDDTNIKPITELLSKVYAIDYKSVVEKFKIGRIQGFRSDIVHNGKVAPVHSQLQDYIRAIFVDALMQLIGYPSEKRAEKVLTDLRFDPKVWMP